MRRIRRARLMLARCSPSPFSSRRRSPDLLAVVPDLQGPQTATHERVAPQASARNSPSATSRGNDRCVPGRCTLSEAQRTPNRTASISPRPSGQTVGERADERVAGAGRVGRLDGGRRDPVHRPVPAEQRRTTRSEGHDDARPGPPGEGGDLLVGGVARRVGQPGELDLVGDDPVRHRQQGRVHVGGRRRVQHGDRPQGASGREGGGGHRPAGSRTGRSRARAARAR